MLNPEEFSLCFDKPKNSYISENARKKARAKRKKKK